MPTFPRQVGRRTVRPCLEVQQQSVRAHVPCWPVEPRRRPARVRCWLENTMNNLPSGNQTYPLEINHGKLGNPLGIFKLVNGKTSMNGASPLPCLTTRFQCKLFREPAYPRCLVQDCEFQIITPTELHEHTHTLTRPTLPHFCQLCTPCLGHFNRPISCHPIINSPIGFSATLEGKSMASAFTPAATLGATLPAAFALRSSRRGSLAGRWASAGPPDKGRDLWKGYKWGCTLWQAKLTMENLQFLSIFLHCYCYPCYSLSLYYMNYYCRSVFWL